MWNHHQNKRPKKMKKPNKKATENDEQPTKTSRQKWPQSDEVLLAQAMISTFENPITGKNQNIDAFWSKIEKYHNESQPSIPRDAHNLRSHWHMFKSKLNRFNELFLQVKSRYRSGWTNDLARKKIKPYMEFQQFLSKSPDVHYRAKSCTSSASPCMTMPKFARPCKLASAGPRLASAGPKGGSADHDDSRTTVQLLA
ncbi:hypothetical protein R6Q57_003412 [Mikania cordata]